MRGIMLRKEHVLVWSLTVSVSLAILAQPLTGPNVCTIVRLVPVTSLQTIPSLPELVALCEAPDSGFTSAACQAASDGRINFSDLYLLQTQEVCCDGWVQQGDTCSPCPSGRYGQNCSLVCQCMNDGVCEHVTGICSCIDGWMGDHCEERCPESLYGPDCSLACLDACQNGGVCHPSNGHCLCDFDWEGATCSVTCQDRACAMESDSCSNGARFDPSGHCHCSPGWRGRYCTEPCPAGLHGPFCDDACQCQNGGLCDWEDGSCLCPPGYTGGFCEDFCDDGFYGPGCDLRCDCPMGASCHHVEGTCMNCPIGFTGDRCTDRCLAGFWGASCGQPCDCTYQAVCDPFIGDCPAVVAAVPVTAGPMTTPTTYSSTEDPTDSDEDSTTTGSMSGTMSHPIPNDNNSSSFNTTGSAFVIPLVVCLLLMVVIVALVVVAVRKPCKRKSTVRSEGAITLTHQYAACTVEKSDGVYAEIGDISGEYEVPMMMEHLQKAPTGDSRQTNQADFNDYKIPPRQAPASGDMKPTTPTGDIPVDSYGYLHLNEARQAPPEYQTMIIAPNKWNLK